MRRSKNSAAEQQARGNFTPAQRTAVPPADAPADPPATAAGGGKGGSGKLSPRNWRVPTRLNAILLIPVGVGLVMGGFQVSASISTWREAQDAEKTALIVRAASEYGSALLDERDLTAEPLLTAKSDEDRSARAVKDAYAKTDAAKEKFDAAVRDMPSKRGLDRRLQLFRGEEPKLEQLRQQAYIKAQDPTRTEEGYVEVQHSLMEFSNELSLGTGNITSFGRTVYALQLAKAAASLQRSIGTHLLVRPSTSEQVFRQQSTAFNSYNYLEQIALGEFVSGGTAEDAENLKRVMAGKATEGGKKLQAAGIDFDLKPGQTVYDYLAAQIGGSPDAESLKGLKSKGVMPETWLGAATAKFDGYGEVESGLVSKAVDEAAAISDDARNDAIITGAVTVIALLTAFILAGMMARQMSRAMRTLRTAAFGIAGQRLPMLVDQLSRTDPGRVDTRVEPIPIDSRDEIGEVARAFDQVHREAVRLAAEQALLRGNVNAIFTNLSQRNQSLIEGQLTLITDLENNEADPDQLENLFRLDHLATRMRRNGENLLILAGEEPGRRWDQPVPLVDVLRAASSEVEAYERIELSGVPETEIHGRAVTDLVHLLAELLENATTFSSPQTKVRVTATRLPDGRVMVEIHDKGIGLTAEDFADINHKLANPPTVDAAISQRMGLFVVGRLSDRHGIRVQLRPSGEQAGTTSLVMLPDAITHGGGDASPDGDFTVSSIIPEQDGYRGAPARTAAELGFDDSQYEQPAGTAKRLDPVDRSLKREERRAGLAAQLNGFERPDQPDRGHGGPEQGGPAGAYDQGRGQEAYGQEAYAQGPYGQDGYPVPGGFGQDPNGHGHRDGFAPAGEGLPGGPGTAGQDGGYPAAADYATGEHTAPGDYPTGELPVQGDYATGELPVQGAYQGTEYGGGGYATGTDTTDGYGTGGYPAQDAYAAGGYPDASAGQGGDRGGYDGFGTGAAHDDWPQQDGRAGHPGQGDQDAYATGYDGLPGAGTPGAPAGVPGNGSERVGFDRPGSVTGTDGLPAEGHELTDAGLPRRGSPRQQAPQQEQSAPQAPSAPQGPREPLPVRGVPHGGDAPQSSPEPAGDADGSDGWRSTNDERWQRAGKLKEPKAGGVTSSGLPRRVPKANLVEGTAEQTPQGGPQVSRAPEDVRGRLSNLRRGVQRGRTAGTDTNGPATYDRPSGPGSTYNQER
ncbi:nitrate- and nitrite sensing domain-containing protein [Streptomyces sp. LP05-1]|uniref:histidine kinase n=1 Tax=Streptomyces pyxinae TaxID=2970734 RepID=A0ABT2CGT2_9ACTN|nr:nitrate- and nitrite sensing domain-containing protein [Streptomyces sp. LP05-1]MCS0636625.1 nitrate- and nitrite sensing domain-containing protein [Streptomyces sp. LP05-1]